jgi:hypothetical protein
MQLCSRGRFLGEQTHRMCCTSHWSPSKRKVEDDQWGYSICRASVTGSQFEIAPLQRADIDSFCLCSSSSALLQHHGQGPSLSALRKCSSAEDDSETASVMKALFAMFGAKSQKGPFSFLSHDMLRLQLH